MRKFIVLFVGFIFVSATLIGQTKAEKKAMKAEAAQKEYAEMKTLIDSGAYTFVADWANSQGGGRINLMTNPNYLKMDNERADAYLPYFGVVQVPSVSGKGGIEFSGLVENYQVEYIDKKQKALIRFNAKDEAESFNITLTVFQNKNSYLTVSSSGRNSINYDGKVAEPEKKEEEN